MRTALVQIKEELGADAVIMSNKKIPEGVELMAAVDYSQSVNVPETAAANPPEHLSVNSVEQPSEAVEHHTELGRGRSQQKIARDIAERLAAREVDNDTVSLGQYAQPAMTSEAMDEPAVNNDSLSALLNRKVQQAVPHQSQPLASAPNAAAHTPSTKADNDIEQQFKDFTQRLQNSAESPVNNTSSADDFSNDDGFDYQAPINDQPSAASSGRVNSHSVDEMDHMKNEMASIRQLLEHQLSGLMWQDMAQKDPARALLVNRLMGLGLTEQVADQIAGYVPSHMNEQDSWQQALALVSQQINTTNNDIIHRGGVVALVGPTGVGKTTTIAKLAARYAQIHGADQVAMISTDSYRIAGFEQLVTYGRIIGCQVKLAQDDQSLDALLQQFSQKKLVLIDTAGMGQRDLRLANHLATLITNARVKIRNYLVLAANTQQRVMQENVERFKKVPLSGCIYTKLDESLSVGEIISTSIQNGLPIGYLTDGQRVPEDIKVANAVKLVTLADKMSAKYAINSSPQRNHLAPSAMNVA